MSEAGAPFRRQRSCAAGGGIGRRVERGSNRVLRRCGTVVLYALVTACGARTSDRPAPGEVQPAEVAAEPVDCDTYADGALLVRAESREEFVAALGEPDSVTTVTWPNRHDGTVTECEVRWAKDSFFGVRFLDDDE